ncbi:VOC family protein [Planococcus halotolerans]|uniref:VOC family protein n=1 Tax=Planococcus halotolerans TaxID=2233542 RepID=A0A365L7T3_9BACL|nr:VOC family protein [Planococcus halotolerans]RAZ81484.1 VOC family protein [Planococcus halotolerans]
MTITTVQKINQIGVPVKDITRAIDFYKEQLGLSLLFSTDTMAFFDCDGLRLMLSLPEKEQFAHASSVIYFEVEDIDRSYTDFQARGVEFSGPPHCVVKNGPAETWMAFFEDTEGNTHALTSDKISS